MHGYILFTVYIVYWPLVPWDHCKQAKHKTNGSCSTNCFVKMRENLIFISVKNICITNIILDRSFFHYSSADVDRKEVLTLSLLKCLRKKPHTHTLKFQWGSKRLSITYCVKTYILPHNNNNTLTLSNTMALHRLQFYSHKKGQLVLIHSNTFPARYTNTHTCTHTHTDK